METIFYFNIFAALIVNILTFIAYFKKNESGVDVGILCTTVIVMNLYLNVHLGN